MVTSAISKELIIRGSWGKTLNVVLALRPDPKGGWREIDVASHHHFKGRQKSANPVELDLDDINKHVIVRCILLLRVYRFNHRYRVLHVEILGERHRLLREQHERHDSSDRSTIAFPYRHPQHK